MSFSTIIVLGRYGSTSGPARGTVTFTRSAPLRNTVTGELLLPAPIVAHLDSEGVLRIALAANDDPTTTPTGTTYTVQEAAGDCTRTYTMSVPYNAPNGTLDLVDVATGSIPGTVSLFAVTGGGGAVDKLAVDPATDSLVIGTPAFTADIFNPLGGPTPYGLVIAGVPGTAASNWMSAVVLVGSDHPDTILDGIQAYTGSGHALGGYADTGTAVYGSAAGAGVGYAGWFEGPVLLGTTTDEPPNPRFASLVLYRDPATGKAVIKEPDGTKHVLW